MSDFEDGSGLATAQMGAVAGSPYFVEIARAERVRTSEPIARIAEIVAVRGDTRPGMKPFPHPFPARMPIEVAEAAVKAISKPGDVILDPMSGSGVVPKAALLSGRNAIGVDIDPLAVIQARALCAAVSLADFEECAADVVARAKAFSGDDIGALRGALDQEERKFVDYWFHREHATQLFALSLAIERYADKVFWPVLATLFSSLIIARDSGASRAMDLSRSRPHRVDSKVPKAPFDLWAKQTSAFRRYYQNSPIVHHADIGVGDARDLALSDEVRRTRSSLRRRI